MPPRKSTASNPPEEGADPAPAPSKASKDKEGLGVDVRDCSCLPEVTRILTTAQDLTLPKSMIARLAKGVLPANTQIQKDALLAMHKSATVFVSYIASNANENARLSNKKTISPQDVISALKDAELEEFIPRLEAELKKYNDTQCDKRNSYRHRVKAEKAEKTGGENGGEGNDAADATDASLLAAQLNGVANGHAEAGGEDGERPSKKFKGTDGHVVITPGEPIDEDEVEDMGADADDDEEEGDEEGDDDEPEDDEGDDDDDDEEVADETMEGMDEPEMDGRGEMKDEALDGNESD